MWILFSFLEWPTVISITNVRYWRTCIAITVEVNCIFQTHFLHTKCSLSEAQKEAYWYWKFLDYSNSKCLVHKFAFIIQGLEGYPWSVISPKKCGIRDLTAPDPCEAGFAKIGHGMWDSDKKESGIRDFHERGAGMRDQGHPFQTLIIPFWQRNPQYLLVWLRTTVPRQLILKLLYIFNLLA